MKSAAVAAILLLFAAGYVRANPEVYTAFVQDISPPLNEMIPDRNCPGITHVITENEGSIRTIRPHQADTVVQTAPAGISIPSTSHNFEGIAANGDIPPDTNGEAGTNQY